MSFLNVHQLMHQVDNPYICYLCGECFPQEHQLNAHVLIHANDKTYSCNTCGAVFHTEQQLKTHQIMRVCHKPYKWEQQLKTHEMMHVTDKHYLYSQDQHLNAHQPVQSLEKHYVCNYCGLKFGAEHHLNAHKLIHTNFTAEAPVTSHPVSSHQMMHTASLNTHHSATPQPHHSTVHQSLSSSHHQSTHSSAHESSALSHQTVAHHSSSHDTASHHTSHTPHHVASHHSTALPSMSHHASSYHSAHPASRLYSTNMHGAGYGSEQDYGAQLVLHNTTNLPVFPQEQQLYTNQAPTPIPKQEPVITKQYNCDLCVSYFPSEELLKAHEEVHKQDDQFKCGTCGSLFAQKGHLKIHMRIHMTEADQSMINPYLHSADQRGIRNPLNEKNYKCTVCEKAFTQKHHLTVHMRVHTGERPYQCSVCEAKFSKNINLKVHMRRHTGEKPFPCTLCDMKFAVKASLQRHHLTHTGEKPYKCDLCDQRFAVKSKLKTHLMSMRCNQQRTKKNLTGEKPYTCDICNTAYATKSSLRSHLQKHSKEKGFECDVCELKFTKKTQLRKHKETHMTKSAFMCDMCGMGFDQEEDLHAHEPVHKDEKSFTCTICDKTFTQKHHIKIHLRIHTGEKPYSCTICDAKFAKDTNLLVHMRKHTGEKPYECTLCEMKFAVKASLQRHVRTHTGERPYKCDLCQKRFAVKSKLKHHVLTHSKVKEKKYKCDECESAFHKKVNLKKHQAKHNKDRRDELRSMEREKKLLFKCNVCDARYASKGCLTKHMNAKHVEVSRPKRSRKCHPRKLRIKIEVPSDHSRREDREKRKEEKALRKKEKKERKKEEKRKRKEAKAMRKVSEVVDDEDENTKDLDQSEYMKQFDLSFQGTVQTKQEVISDEEMENQEAAVGEDGVEKDGETDLETSFDKHSPEELIKLARQSTEHMISKLGQVKFFNKQKPMEDSENDLDESVFTQSLESNDLQNKVPNEPPEIFPPRASTPEPAQAESDSNINTAQDLKHKHDAAADDHIKDNAAFLQKPRICSLNQAADTRFSQKSDDKASEDYIRNNGWNEHKAVEIGEVNVKAEIIDDEELPQHATDPRLTSMDPYQQAMLEDTNRRLVEEYKQRVLENAALAAKEAHVSHVGRLGVPDKNVPTAELYYQAIQEGGTIPVPVGQDYRYSVPETDRTKHSEANVHRPSVSESELVRTIEGYRLPTTDSNNRITAEQYRQMLSQNDIIPEAFRQAVANTVSALSPDLYRHVTESAGMRPLDLYRHVLAGGESEQSENPYRQTLAQTSGIIAPEQYKQSVSPNSESYRLSDEQSAEGYQPTVTESGNVVYQNVATNNVLW